jgi:hypothetical protein
MNVPMTTRGETRSTKRSTLVRLALAVAVVAGIVVVSGGTASARHDPICDHEFGGCFRECGTNKQRCSSGCGPADKPTPAQQHCVENCQFAFSSCEKKCMDKRKACEHKL